jgi:hypothetical protein
MIAKTSIVTLMAALLIFFNMGSTSAKDFEPRISLEERSRAVGLDGDSIKLIRRLPGPGRDLVLDKLANRFKRGKGNISTAGKSKRVEREVSSSILGDGWRLKVWGSGSKFSYFDQKHTRQPQYKIVRLKERFTNQTLEKMGRKFIKKELGWLIDEESEKEIVPLFTEFEIAGGVNADGKAEEETVISSIIIFGRRIDDVDVVGAGSQIVIYFGNDGVPFGFDVDWPRYERTQVVQKTIPVDQILKRLSKVSSKNSSAGKVELRRFECGYFDAGERNYDPDSHIQAGCVVHRVYIKRDKNSGVQIKTPILYDVPAGVQIIRDKNWWEAQLIGGKCVDNLKDDCISTISKTEKGQDKSEEGHVEGLSDK